jgi:hypothetical protein
MRGHFFTLLRFFSSLSHDDSSFVGASDVSQFSVQYNTYFWRARPRPDARRVPKARLLSQTPAYPEVATRHIIATSLPQRRTAGPNTGLCISTYVLGIGQTNTSGSSRIDRYSLWKSPPRASFRVVHSKSHKIHFGAL